MIENLYISELEIKQIKQLVRTLYKNEKGDPFEATTGQAIIFCTIFKRKHHRVHIEAYTRYGKSEIVAMAVLTRVATYPEKWSIVAGNKEKAGIIMADIIKHIFDNDFTATKFRPDPGESVESIRRYKNKDRINFKVDGELLGEVYVCTAKSALGFGAPNIVEDEAALISDKEHAMIMRMLGDLPDNYLVKIGNPWPMDHFIRSYENKEYAKIIIDYVQGIKEGRILPAYVDEMRKEKFFDVLYECKFPSQSKPDAGNWVPLLSRDEISRALVEKDYPAFGIKKLGVDVAGGGRNFSVIIERTKNLAKIDFRENTEDTMVVAERVLTKKRDRNIHRGNIAMDKVGLGRGAYDVVNRELPGVVGVNAGDKLPDNSKESQEYVNLRAFLFWEVRTWILGGGKLELDVPLEKKDESQWFELSKVKYKTKLEGTKGKIQIMPKDQMLKEGVESPDVADGLSMTFAAPDVLGSDIVDEELEEMRRQAAESEQPIINL